MASYVHKLLTKAHEILSQKIFLPVTGGENRAIGHNSKKLLERDDFAVPKSAFAIRILRGRKTRICMLNYVFAALVALCFAVPGTVEARSVVSEEMVMAPEIAPHVVEAILHAAAEQSEWTFGELEEMYMDGAVAIDQIGTSYLVAFSDGGVSIILSEDSI